MSKENIHLSLKLIIQQGNCLYYEKGMNEDEIENQTNIAEEWAMQEISKLSIIDSLKNKYYPTGLKLLLYLVIAKYITEKDKLSDDVLFKITLIARKCLNNKNKIEIDFDNLLLLN